jgi:1,4-dihydroxy-6-naphthoate synthase
LLIARNKFGTAELEHLKVTIPGEHTTANFLFSYAFPKIKNKEYILFSEIEDAVANNKVDAGVIIHENRFTYALKGLVEIMDLGEYWESQTHTPIPLGGIAVRREFKNELKFKVERIIKKSIEFAFLNPELSLDFIRKNAQALNDEVIKKHIQLYVNDFSISLGDKGKEAIELFFDKAYELGFLNELPKDIFV